MADALREEENWRQPGSTTTPLYRFTNIDCDFKQSKNPYVDSYVN
jgi:hypothetical protein